MQTLNNNLKTIKFALIWSVDSLLPVCEFLELIEKRVNNLTFYIDRKVCQVIIGNSYWRFPLSHNHEIYLSHI